MPFSLFLCQHEPAAHNMQVADVNACSSGAALGSALGQGIAQGAGYRLPCRLVCWCVFPAECGSKGVSVKPKVGDALLFWSLKVGP